MSNVRSFQTDHSDPSPPSSVISSEEFRRLESLHNRGFSSTSDSYNASRGNDCYQPPRRGPILHKSPTTTQLIKTRLSRFFCRIAHCRYDRRRIPSSKQVIVLLIICCFERTAYYAATSLPFNMLFQSNDVNHGLTSFSLLIQDVIPQLLFPIAGWVGDVYLGRFKAIQIGLLFIGVSCCTLLVETAVFYTVYPACCGELLVNKPDGWLCGNHALTACFVLSFLILYTGSALFQANLIPYGADMMSYEYSSNDISSYFYWYYWVRNFGSPIVCLSLVCLLGVDDNVTGIFLSLIACICISLALVVCFTTRNLFYNERLYYNPYKKLLQIINYSLRAKRPRSRAAFGIGHDPPPRIDLAKRRHGGWFTNEEVEDVKTVGRLLLMFLCFGFLFIVHSAALNGVGLQVDQIAPEISRKTVFTSKPSLMKCHPARYYLWAGCALVIIIFLPLLDQVMYPILGEFTPSMLRRIGTGFVLVLFGCSLELIVEHLMVSHVEINLSNLSCGAVDKAADRVVSYYILLILLVPVVLLALAEISGKVSGLCFVYAQSPSNTRGMMTGLFFGIAGLFMLIADILSLIFSKKLVQYVPTNWSETCLFWYFLAVLILTLASLLMYIIGTKQYRNRQRGELETSEPFYFRPQFLNIWGKRRCQQLRDNCQIGEYT